MKKLTLYIDKWYIIGAVCTDGVPRLVIPTNKEDRYWLYFYEDTTNNEIVYGKDNQIHYHNNEPHYYGDVFTEMTDEDSYFLYYSRKQELFEIFKVSGILASLRESMEMQETDVIETYVSFSKDISDDARYLFLTNVLTPNHFEVKESVARIEHLALEHSFRNGQLQDDGFFLILNACNENLHVSLYEKQGKACVRHNEMILEGYGRDLRYRAILENVVGCINQRTNFLSSSLDFEREYQRLGQSVDNWLIRLDNTKVGCPISISNVSFSGMTNQYSVMVLKKDIDSLTHIIVDDVIREIDNFVKKSRVENDEVKGVVFLGNTFTNKQFLESIHSRYILSEENYLFYRESELPNIVGVYSIMDCSQFSDETHAVMDNGELELIRKRRAKEEKERQDGAKRRKEEQLKKDKEVREAERRYKDAMDNVASFERKQEYAQMLDWANIALTHRPEDKEAVAKKEEATRLLSEQKVRQQQYNSIIQRAEASLKKQAYQDALSQSDAALNFMPSSEQAKQIHDEARKALDNIVRVKEYMTRADLFLAQKSYKEAMEELRKVLSIDDKNVMALNKIGKIKKEFQKQNEAIQTLLEVVEQSKTTIDDYAKSIKACKELLNIDVINQRKWTERLGQLDKEKSIFEENERLWVQLNSQINKALFDEDWQQVVTCAEKALKIRLDDSLKNNLQIAREKLDKQQAETRFKQQINEVKALLVDKDFDSAKKMLSDMQNKYPIHSSEMKALFKQIFDEENSREHGLNKKNRDADDFFASSCEQHSSNSKKGSCHIDDDFFGFNSPQIKEGEPKKKKVGITNADFDF